VDGTAPGSDFETAHLDLSWHLPTGTYLAWEGVALGRRRSPSAVFESSTTNQPVITALRVGQNVKFEEKSLTANVNQTPGSDWALGARYRITNASLKDRPTGEAAPFWLRRSWKAPPGSSKLSWQQTLRIQAIFRGSPGFVELSRQPQARQHRCFTFFSNMEGRFWQFNLFTGYRFCGRRAECWWEV